MMLKVYLSIFKFPEKWSTMRIAQSFRTVYDNQTKNEKRNMISIYKYTYMKNQERIKPD